VVCLRMRLMFQLRRPLLKRSLLAAREDGMCSADRLHIIVIAWVTLSWHICHGKPTPLWSNDGDLSN
jgi:hypothetical protein